LVDDSHRTSRRSIAKLLSGVFYSSIVTDSTINCLSKLSVGRIFGCVGNSTVVIRLGDRAPAPAVEYREDPTIVCCSILYSAPQRLCQKRIATAFSSPTTKVTVQESTAQLIYVAFTCTNSLKRHLSLRSRNLTTHSRLVFRTS
jgi:hypothetical protein